MSTEERRLRLYLTVRRDPIWPPSPAARLKKLGWIRGSIASAARLLGITERNSLNPRYVSLSIDMEQGPDFVCCGPKIYALRELFREEVPAPTPKSPLNKPSTGERRLESWTGDHPGDREWWVASQVREDIDKILGLDDINSGNRIEDMRRHLKRLRERIRP